MSTPEIIQWPEKPISKSFKHGHARRKKSAEYRAWVGMFTRCRNKNNKYWLRYGGRGIKVCERWSSFEMFLEDMGLIPEGKSLDRKNNDGDYCKENCQWATKREQAANRKSTRWITFNGKTLYLAEWARLFGKDRSNFAILIKKHGLEEAFRRAALASIGELKGEI